MSLFNVFNIAGSAMSAQSQRLNTTASNLANADSTTSANGLPYKAKQVIFSAVPMKDQASSGVKVNKVIEDNSPPRVLYDPKNPKADAKGYVTMPNVNVTEEMVNMISASRAYQNNVETMNAAKTMLLKTLTIGQS
ncbi:MAG: flagellar basal body rod protein FlgC [Methylophilaceae bacterium]|jgi:flagellar basal-body rod protein FlgC|uniref:Flagellar basal-body rod protein FlgC n=1 Tax=Methyloradius palustris TaxID=2778876 RepID=A0A8D5GBX9_9PROT|nr:flagellar basal body rod protein FlgC [Methyloradius palustris]BCM25456.1 flagellar basal-body rod protein FlgC [Methyloradius palustris]HSH97604.1 flagellar basal body rod protein FlgC [Methyloradius sp.]